MSDKELGFFRGNRGYNSLVKANDRAKELLVIFRQNLAAYEAKLEALQL